MKLFLLFAFLFAFFIIEIKDFFKENGHSNTLAFGLFKIIITVLVIMLTTMISFFPSQCRLRFQQIMNPQTEDNNEKQINL